MARVSLLVSLIGLTCLVWLANIEHVFDSRGRQDKDHELDPLDGAIELLEKANAGLEPELLCAADARVRLDSYARAQKLVTFGIVALSRKIDDATQVARATGTSIGKAKETVATGKVMRA